ncbi:MAG TPA: 3-deoxy-manno-octulosonate cytidylyltransferase [Nitrospirae bacterium]|nr:3-deoxy-manno-octulosonate cytidylyltransferase [bacterium BMS3Abin10]GBE38203.1 3-deoxy-manno-octulosonate cytidylyltransferase [bacterium BMS3Bbin08]HDH51789.1 3-deoxy-manno-octulosonate cytidylyltransferase [Nitrospirota bacterium]HDK17206.1 3-deoxy-manno-octulosonate cytidylyltransferase [Nitrospirota bacterium]HDO25693.1 3-deoxy-manno-octulosonate cytidylyltransferase [Nitrospirota bacterium]
MPKVVAIIPARFDSTRFPGKPLAVLKGKPLIQHVHEQVAFANHIEAIVVATDNKTIFDTVTGFGGHAVMTSSGHLSGTDRVAEAARDIDCEMIINIQGDEPFIKPEMVDDVVELLNEDPNASISTLAKRTADVKEILSPDVVKVVVDNEGFAMYFSRSPIPYYRDEWKGMGSITFTNAHVEVLKHIGIYGFRKNVLMNFSGMGPCRLEMSEKLEQLRALAAGIKIKVKETPYDTFGIDTIEDLRKAEEWLSLSL